MGHLGSGLGAESLGLGCSFFLAEGWLRAYLGLSLRDSCGFLEEFWGLWCSVQTPMCRDLKTYISEIFESLIDMFRDLLDLFGFKVPGFRVLRDVVRGFGQ